ncbi:hypothetical protein DKT77_12660 [Meridianimarinicoccus roseus]|uniref:Uncharacterized protein n=2 Tax=Meridianimarinicoccus roseus TaxID=2072018 RepID=A0A2V2LAZ8_9RHOB|nr:hypothetical protein DKT77_12660 [Meridianimarinicoccus roseus]
MYSMEGIGPDTTCAVAIHISGDPSVVYFSGKVGYETLIKRVGGSANAARDIINGQLNRFLASTEGGGFTMSQITKRGVAKHQRGAVNCAEPKVYFHIKHIKNADPRNYVLIPFRKDVGGVSYNPPCENCARWVYGTFHARTNELSRFAG